MVKYEDECCDCAVPAYPCQGDKCSKRHVKHLYCDMYGEDVEELYNGMCVDCYLESAETHDTIEEV